MLWNIPAFFVLSSPLTANYFRPMDGKYTDIELAFIDEQLGIHGEYLRDLLMQAIKRKRLVKTWELYEGITWHRAHRSRPELEFYFPDYGRFIEINYHKKIKTTNTKMWAQNHESANRSILGLGANKNSNRRKKDTRFYARTAYGAMNELIGRIMAGYSDIELERLKESILKRQTL